MVDSHSLLALNFGPRAFPAGIGTVRQADHELTSLAESFATGLDAAAVLIGQVLKPRPIPKPAGVPGVGDIHSHEEFEDARRERERGGAEF